MNYEDKIQEHIFLADKLIKDVINTLSPIYKENGEKFQDVTVPLFTSLHSTSESILVLLSFNSALFDADVLLRSVIEGTIKYCYLMSGNNKEKNEKYLEYKIQLTDLDKISDHKKATKSISILKKFSQNSTKTLETMLLNDQEFNQLQAKYPRNTRNSLKTKWSYLKLIESLAKNNQVYEAQLATLSAYSLSSHLVHYDWTSVSMRQEQINIAHTEKNIELDFAHGIRIISNMLTLYVLRISEYYRSSDKQPDDILELSAAILDYASELVDVGNTIIETFSW